MIDWLEEVLREGQSLLAEELKLSAVPVGRPAARETGAEEPGQEDGPSVSREEASRDLSFVLGKWTEDLDGTAVGKALPGGQASGVERLYRRMAEAVAVSPVSAAAHGVIREEQTAEAAGLTVRELDRAVRRDSRRYDGGMSIY